MISPNFAHLEESFTQTAGCLRKALTAKSFLCKIKLQLNNSLIVRERINEQKGIFIMKKSYKIDVDCANCANKMEEAAQKTPGVKNAVVNFMTLKMNVEFEEAQDPKAVMRQVRTNCKKVEDECEVYL